MTKTKFTDDQKLERRFQRQADERNAKARDEAGMFADVPGVVEEVTADDMWRRWRRNKALAAEDVAATVGSALCGLMWVELQAVERWAIELLGQALAMPLIEYVRRVYPMPDYGRSVWCELLSGRKEIVYRWRLEFSAEHVSEHNRDGRYLVAEGKFPPEGWVPPLTREQFWERFPYKDPEPDPEPDDGGLFGRVMAALEVGR